MNDACQIKVLNGVKVQENGIVRNSKGRIIARLVDSVEFDSEHLEQTNPLSDEEIEQLAKRKANQILMDLLMPDVGEPKKIDWNIGCTNQHLVNFARAIEERHGIK